MRIGNFAGRAAGAYRPRAGARRVLARSALALALAAGAGLIGAPAHADATRDAQWQLNFLKVAEAHKITQGEGITVAVIDTGVDASHPDLRGNVLPGVDAWDTKSPGKGQKDLVGHGTGIASLIAGHGHGPGNKEGVLGIAPKAKILPINVKNPKFRAINQDTVGVAIEYAAVVGADVICVALGSGFSTRQQEAVDAARQRGALVIAAAGNRANGLTVMDYPAAYAKTVAVSAVDRNGDISKISVAGDTMDIAAPGVDLTMARSGGGYWKATGTSGAAAIAAGAAALIRAKYREPGSNLFLNRLLLNASDRGEPGLDEQYGWGVVDLMTSLTRMPPTLTPSASAEIPSTPWDTPSETLHIRTNWGSFIEAGLILLAIIGVIAILVVWLRRRSRRRAAASAVPAAAKEAPVSQPVPDTHWQRSPSDGHPPPGPPPDGG